MQINLNFDTDNMTKEQLSGAQKRIQEALDQVKHALRTSVKAKHMHIPDVFFGVPFDVEIMSTEELEHQIELARSLLFNFIQHINHSVHGEKEITQTFFGVEFDFSKLDNEKLESGRKEVMSLIQKLLKELELREKLESIGHGDST